MAETEVTDGLFANQFWGNDRHVLIAATAQEKLKDKTLQKVKSMLGEYAQDGLPGVANWLDTVRRKTASDFNETETVNFLLDPRNKKKDDWHYVDLPLGADTYDFDALGYFVDDEDVVQMLIKVIKSMQDDSDRFTDLTKLRLVTHMASDITQPLHVGCGYIDKTSSPAKIEWDPKVIVKKKLESDRGGNFIFPGKVGNLHSYWDSKLASGPLGFVQPLHANNEASLDANVKKLLKVIDEQLSVESLGFADSPVSGDILSWPQMWATETLQFAKEAYRGIEITGPLPGGKPTDYSAKWEGKAKYEKRCAPIVEKQVAKAAQNLALILNTLYA